MEQRRFGNRDNIAADWRLSAHDYAAIGRILADEGVSTYLDVEQVT